MSAANRSAISAALKLAVFTLISLILTGTLVAIMGKFGAGPTHEYAAIFTSASMLDKGDDVRVAGVVVGKVKKVEVHRKDQARVVFTMGKEFDLTEASRVEIRYLDLVGGRYLTVMQGKPGAAPLDPGGTLAVQQTVPALNLTALYDGFAPLFAALEPDDVNKLSLNLIKVLQGESGTIEDLLASTASLTSTLADRDELIGRVVTNLTGLLTTVDSRHDQLTELISELNRWIGGLAADRTEIGSAVENVSAFTEVLADLLTEARPLLKSDLDQLRTLARTLASSDGKAVLKKILANLPQMLEDQTRTGTYGSWYNYYVCGVKVDIALPKSLRIPGLEQLTKQLRNFSFHSTASRCNS